MLLKHAAVGVVADTIPRQLFFSTFCLNTFFLSQNYSAAISIGDASTEAVNSTLCGRAHNK